MEKHIRNWLPCSAFSKFALGTFTGIVVDLIFPGTALLRIGICVVAYSIGQFLKKRFQISEYFIFGIFFLAYVSFVFPERFQKNPEKKSFSVSKKNPFGKPEKIFQEKFREQVLLELKEADLEKNSGRVALGLIFGEAKQLSGEFKTKAKEGGILHLFAASGLHLGILMGVQFRLLSLMPSLGYNLPRIIPLLTGFLYLSALGYPVSLARAWIFAGMLLFQGLFFRKLRSADLLLGSAWILWIADPPRFYTVSFCLSFGAVAGIFFFSYPIQIACDFLSDENRITSFFKENLSISFSAGLGTMPVLLFAFGSFSFGSILLNLILVPLAGILLPILYLSLLVQKTKLTFLAEPLWSITEFLIQILIYLSETLSKPLGFYREMGEAVWIGIFGWLLLCFIIFFYSYFIEKKYLRRIPITPKLVVKKEVLSSGGEVSNLSEPFLKNENTETWSKRSGLQRCETQPYGSPRKLNEILNNIQNSEYYSFPAKGIFGKKSYPILCVLFFTSVFGIHVLLYQSPNLFPTTNRIVNNRFFFVLRNGDSLIFSGKCKYGTKTISKAFRTSKKIYCDSTDKRPLKNVFVEHESCLTWAFPCLSDRTQIDVLYSGRDFELWSRASRFRILKSNPIREIPLSNRSKILFFHTKKDSLIQLAQKTKTGGGWILLETPFGTRDDSEVWNRNRKLLGLSESWVFLEKDELQRIPISESF
ncbi:competence protein [Leptospira weilii serovar Ranarum str. ICFT]|uniref:Competence protein n=1 Tax=Leptospira weilii serovar Ranarum str. ICFT TaxID=1218598 RepID=N1WGA1_9LEPT|nr:ComEC/Rec2 family competence protein [Leptospira weilii]EMY79296.1 competence protein [Leptospira weilii serovar Ranarum str. ICFT]